MADVNEIRQMRESAEELGLPAVVEVLQVLIELHHGQLWEDLFDAVTRAKQAIGDLEREAVRWARMEGETWESIGDYLGISRQGAQKRYGSTDLRELDELDALHRAEVEALTSEMNLAVAREKRKLGDLPDDQREQLARERVLADPSWFDRRMRLMRKHSEERHELLAEIDDR